MLLPRSLASITNCCGSDRAKFPLDTVELSRDEKGNAVAVTTDGKRVIVAKWNDTHQSKDYFESSEGQAKVTPDPNLNILVPIKPFDEIFKAIPKKCTKHPVLEHAHVVETEVGKTITLETREEDGTVRKVCPKPVTEMPFPMWRASVPEYELRESDPTSNKAVRLRVDAELLAELVKTIFATAGKDNPLIDLIIPENQLKPLEIRSHNDQGIYVTGLLFPFMSPNTKVPFTGALPANAPAVTVTA